MNQPDPSFLLSAGVAQAVQRVLAVAFGNKLRWFESHCRHISLCSQGSSTRASIFVRLSVPSLSFLRRGTLIRNRDYITFAFSSRKCVTGREVDGTGSKVLYLRRWTLWFCSKSGGLDVYSTSVIMIVLSPDLNRVLLPSPHRIWLFTAWKADISRTSPCQLRCSGQQLKQHTTHKSLTCFPKVHRTWNNDVFVNQCLRAPDE